jgi:pimeloyl-ACP methyl ester carboxylesterase
MQFPELEYLFPYKTVLLNNKTEIAYRDEGDGNNVLLFVHGLASYIPAWNKNIPHLKDKFRCIAIDLPGYGKSSAGIFPGTMSFYAEVIKDFISVLGLKDVILVGHSMGGQICLSTTIKYPRLVNKLVLLGSAGIETYSSKQVREIKEINTVEAFAQSREERIRISFASNFYKAPADIEFMIKDRLDMRGWKNFDKYCRVVINSLHGLLDEPVFDRLCMIKQPVLVVYGRNDRFIPNVYVQKKLKIEDVAELAEKNISNSEVHILDECGHFLQWEKADVNNTLIESFVI